MEDSKGSDAVSNLIGAMLLFGLIIILLALIQLQMVPVWILSEEIDHQEKVQGDMAELRTSVSSVASTGFSESAAIELGMNYPDFFVLRTPISPAGTVTTSGRKELNITNAVTETNTETGDFWNGDTRTYNTTLISTFTDYNRLNAPVTRYGNSVVYSQDEKSRNASLLSGQTLINGRKINLFFLSGDFTISKIGSTSIDVQPVSTSNDRISVTEENSVNPIKLVVPTFLPKKDWKEMMDKEQNAKVSNYSSGTSETPGTVNITLDKGVTYDVKMAKINVGNSSTDRKPAYLTKKRQGEIFVPEGGSTKLTVQLRDRFNNPVWNESLESENLDNDSLTEDAMGTVKPQKTGTGIDGKAEFRYEAKDDVSVTDDQTDKIKVFLDSGLPDDRGTVIFNVTVRSR
ncbi:MAG: hypothetical protein ABEK59_04855 [Halobacteria archaeon]